MRARADAGAARDEIDRRIAEIEHDLEQNPYHFDRRFLFRVLSMGHSQLAELIGARGPNTQINAACASTTQAVSMAEDWIRAGRCRRVVIVAADDVTSETLLPWVGSGFLASGAAATDEVVEDAALPFDRRRHGMILGMGAAGIVVESAAAARERGVTPICEVLGAVTANSAFHGTRLDVEHIGGVMESVVRQAEARGVTRDEIAPETMFVSHETYTPARGGSAAAEIHALRRVFGEHADRIVIANTKGITGHTMGVGVEDIVAIKALETGLVPAVPNFREIDPELGALNLSKGGQYPVRYALRLAAGFGSQISMLLLRWTPVADGRRRHPEELGYEYRIADQAVWKTWLRGLSRQAEPQLEVVKRHLRVVDTGPATNGALTPVPVAEPVAAPAPVIARRARRRGPRPSRPPAPVAAPVAPPSRPGARPPPAPAAARPRRRARRRRRPSRPAPRRRPRRSRPRSWRSSPPRPATRPTCSTPISTSRPTSASTPSNRPRCSPPSASATGSPATTPSTCATTRPCATSSASSKTAPHHRPRPRGRRAARAAAPPGPPSPPPRPRRPRPRRSRRRADDGGDHGRDPGDRRRPDRLPGRHARPRPRPRGRPRHRHRQTGRDVRRHPRALRRSPATTPSTCATTPPCATSSASSKTAPAPRPRTRRRRPPRPRRRRGPRARRPRPSPAAGRHGRRARADDGGDHGRDPGDRRRPDRLPGRHARPRPRPRSRPRHRHRQTGRDVRRHPRALRRSPATTPSSCATTPPCATSSASSKTAPAPRPRTRAAGARRRTRRRRARAAPAPRRARADDRGDHGRDPGDRRRADRLPGRHARPRPRPRGRPRHRHRQTGRDVRRHPRALRRSPATTPSSCATTPPCATSSASSTTAPHHARPRDPRRPRRASRAAASRAVAAPMPRRAGAFPRRVPVPVLRPPLAACVDTGVTLDAGIRVVLMPDQRRRRGGAGGAAGQARRRGAVARPGARRRRGRGAARRMVGDRPDRGRLLAARARRGGPARRAGARRGRARRCASASSCSPSRMRALPTRAAFLVSGTRLGGRHGYDARRRDVSAGRRRHRLHQGAGPRAAPTRSSRRSTSRPARHAAALADLLVEETLRDPGAVEIGHADELRWSVGLIEEPDAPPNPARALTRDTVFVVTGAAGSIVSAITADLAAACRRHVPPARPRAGARRRRSRTSGASTPIRTGSSATSPTASARRGERPTPKLVERELARIERARAALAADRGDRARGRHRPLAPGRPDRRRTPSPARWRASTASTC